MAKRPIRLMFRVGKGLVKVRRESDNPTQFVIQQATLQFADQEWDKVKNQISVRIASDVRGELVHTAAAFRRNVIGAPGSQRGLVGTLTTVSKSDDMPKESLSTLPRWAPRGARYLEEKQIFTGHQDWFDNSTWHNRGKGRKVNEVGRLRELFSSDEVGTQHFGSGGILEEIFGGISVQVSRNNTGTGENAGSLKVGRDNHVHTQLGTIRVRALGSVTREMMRISSKPNIALLGQIAKLDPVAAVHLRGGRGVYRPTLEPYLQFFLERAIPHAVMQRLAKGTTTGVIY